LYSTSLCVCAWQISVLNFHKQRVGEWQTTAPDAELQQLVKDAATDDVELLKQVIAEVETAKATMQYEV